MVWWKGGKYDNTDRLISQWHSLMLDAHQAFSSSSSHLSILSLTAHFSNKTYNEDTSVAPADITGFVDVSPKGISDNDDTADPVEALKVLICACMRSYFLYGFLACMSTTTKKKKPSHALPFWPSSFASPPSYHFPSSIASFSERDRCIIDRWSGLLQSAECCAHSPALHGRQDYAGGWRVCAQSRVVCSSGTEHSCHCQLPFCFCCSSPGYIYVCIVCMYVLYVLYVWLYVCDGNKTKQPLFLLMIIFHMYL